MGNKSRRQRGHDRTRRVDPHSFSTVKPSRLQRQQKRGWKRGRK